MIGPTVQQTRSFAWMKRHLPKVHNNNNKNNEKKLVIITKIIIIITNNIIFKFYILSP